MFPIVEKLVFTSKYLFPLVQRSVSTTGSLNIINYVSDSRNISFSLVKASVFLIVGI